MDRLQDGQVASQPPAAPMDISSTIAEFVHRYQALSLHRDSLDNLIKDLIVYSESVESSLREENTNLLSKLREKELDLEDATRSRRDLQQQVQQLHVYRDAVLQDRHHLKNSNPYVIALMDGDGLIFKESFIAQGAEGGKKAAYALQTAILEQCGSYAGDIEVVAKVYANMTGLCNSMRRDGSLSNESHPKDFFLGFTQAKASFDFVDVGHGKEEADNKIRETTKWHLRNNNCKQVILGISHDAGHAPFLDELFQDPSLRSRVTVLEGSPTAPELAATGVNLLNLNERLFRSEKLIDRVPIPPESFSPPAVSVKAKAATASVTSVGTSTPATSAASTPAQAPATTYARAAVKNPIPPPPPPPQATLPTQTKLPPATPRPQQTTKSTTWNPGPRGLDPPLHVSQSALDTIKKRREHKNKLCNNHYLRGPCAKGAACSFEHSYRPTRDELVAIAFLTRLNPCSNGQRCEVGDCIYGHHCPSVREGVCTHPFCKFGKEDHPPGTRIRLHKS
ncbi:hypothetical protein N658DRAFT_495868 [Parathielavia hyrcaniae]|uniref:C3H1-type domain-containing protein n=1 Tax=Parathielavia hyrcaniae TaxID=113614 RepID=A0AAN6Q1K7_9PEZI|nr:hypothetical protein N658DRAFT_495868 [Parathielavia hyrcaniae]